MHWYWQNVGKDNYKLFFGVFQMHWYWQNVGKDNYKLFFDVFQMHWYWQNVGKDNYKLFFGVFQMHWYWQNVGKDNYKLFFCIFQMSCGPWLMSEFCFHLISWEQIAGIWWNFVCAVLWPTHEIFPNFSTVIALDWC